MLHFECIHDRLLDHATLTLPVQCFDCFRQTYIIFRARHEYGKFLHFENFGPEVGLRQLREEVAARDPQRQIQSNWEKQVARQAFETSMHSEARYMGRQSRTDSPAVHRDRSQRRADPMAIWRSEQVPPLLT